MLKFLVMLASIANCAGGLVLIVTKLMMWPQVPPIVLFIGGSLLIQGVYTILYLRGDLNRWGASPLELCSRGRGFRRVSAPAGWFRESSTT